MDFLSPIVNKNKLRKKEKTVLVPRFLQATKTTVVVNDLPKVVSISKDKVTDVLSFGMTMDQIQKSKMLQQAMKLGMVEAAQENNYL